MSAVREFLSGKLEAALAPQASLWLRRASEEIAAGAGPARFAELLALASRYMPRARPAWTAAEISVAYDLCEGWNPERSTPLETARAVLVLARPDLAEEGGARAIEEAFRHADVGELCALYRSLPLLPAPERFTWRAGEGCRSSMGAVFEAVACDSPFPVRHFDDGAWRQMVIKCLFVEAPLWRVFGLDTRLDAELARMALDLAEERRSAGRSVRHELWLCLGRNAAERGLASIERELAGAYRPGRRAASVALARAGAIGRLSALAGVERDPVVADTMRRALQGWIDPRAFAVITPE